MARCWQMVIERLSKLLDKVEVDTRGSLISPDEGFAVLRERMEQIRDTHRTIYLIGNGASASMASHFSADLAKNGHVNTQVFTDNALITAISNDMGYEWVFAEPLRRRGDKGDMVICISSSGRSPNLLKAIDVANKLEMYSVTLTAFDDENPLRRRGRLNFFVHAKTYSDAESCHAVIMHHAINQVVAHESKTVELKYEKLFTELSRSQPKTMDSARFLP